MRRCFSALALGLGLMGLAGCATTSLSEGYFFQQRGEYQLVNRNNDLYLERLDGKESRRLTNTPENVEFKARFVADGEYIIYLEFARRFPVEAHKAFIIPADGDDSERKEITQEQLETLQ